MVCCEASNNRIQIATTSDRSLTVCMKGKFAWLHTHTHTHIHTCTHTHIYIHTHTYTHTHTQEGLLANMESFGVLKQ